MKKFRSFSYYYTLLVVTILVFGSAFFLPYPFRVIQPLILVPTFLYFWLNITNPEEATEAEWSTRATILVLGLVALGLFGYGLTVKMNLQATKTAEETKQDEDTINQLRDEINSLKESMEDGSKESTESAEALGDATSSSEEISDLLKYLDGKTENATPTPSPQATVTGQVRIINKEEVDVYQQNSLTARIIGIATLGTTYPFYESTGNWYLIEYAMDKQGWIESKNTIEVNN